MAEDDRDRFTWEWDDLVWDLNIPKGKVHTMKSDDEVEKDAEIAERNTRSAGEHLTPMAGGNVQADLAETGDDDLVEKVTPEGNEGQEGFMDRCIHNLISEGKTPQKSADQCYAIWHSSKGTSRKSQDAARVKKAAIVRLITKGAISVAGMFVRKTR